MENYWPFAAFCLVVTGLLVRLVIRERISLQGSLLYLLFLGTLTAFAIFPSAADAVAHTVGFTLLSNFFFAVIAGMFSLLHLGSLIALSKAETRTVALVQEVAIMKERLDDLAPSGPAIPMSGPLDPNGDVQSSSA